MSKLTVQPSAFDRVRIDDRDVALLELLQTNTRVRLEDLGREVGLAASSIHERLRRLDQEGVIRAWTVELEPHAFGLDTLALVGIRASAPCSELVDLLTPIAEIEGCYSVAGELSLVLKVRVGSSADLLALIEGLRDLPGIEGTVTTMILKAHFERGLQPVRR